MSDSPALVSTASPLRNKHLPGVFALVLALAFAGWNIKSWPAKLRYPGEYTDNEGMRLAEMVHLRQGLAIYSPPSAERFDSAIYGPLYYLLGSRLIDARQPAYFPLRCVSLAATLCAAACCGLLAFWLGRSGSAAALAPLVFLSYGFVTRLGVSARADSLAALLAFAGLLAAYRFQQNRTILLAVPVMLTAFFYKPQFVAGPLAVFLFLLFQKRRLLAMQFAGLMLLGVVAGIGIFQFLIFPGQAFATHFIYYNRIPLSWPHFIHAGMWFLGLVLLVPLLMALEFLRHRRFPLLGCYLGSAAVLSLITTARAGSDSQYWFECVLILSVLVAALVAERTVSGAFPWDVMALLSCALFVAQFFVPPGPRPEDFARDQAIQDFLRGRFPPQTRVFTTYAGDIIRAGLDVPIDVDTYLYHVRTGRFDVSQQESLLQAQHYGAVVLNFDIRVKNSPKARASGFPQPWVQAILDEYDEIGTLEMPGPERVFDDDRFHIWVPHSPSPAPNQVTPDVWQR